MATSITSTQYTRYPVRNPIRFIIEDDAAVTGTDERGAVKYLFSACPDAGATWQINGEDGFGEVVFLFTDTPTNPSDVLRDVGVTVNEWVRDNLVPVMQANYALTQRFHVFYSASHSACVFLVNRARNAFNTTVMPGEVQTGFSASQTLYTGGNLVPDADTRFLLQVLIEQRDLPTALSFDPDYFDIISEDQFQPANAEGGAIEVSVHDVLQKVRELRHVHPSPTLHDTAEMTSGSLRFFIKVLRRQIGSGGGDQALVSSDVSFAYAAGRSEQDILTNPDWKAAMYPTSHVRFLTNWPNLDRTNAKSITPDQKEYLCFIPNTDTAFNTTAVIVTLYYADGTNSGLQTITTLNALKADRQYVLPFGINFSELATIDPTKAIIAFSLFLRPVALSGGTVTSELRWYKVDYNHHEGIRYAEFFNSLGGIDVLAVTGRQQAQLEVDMITTPRTVTGADDASLAAQRSTMQRLRGINEPATVSSRLLSRAELIAAREVYFSDAIVLRETINDQVFVRPITLTEKKMDAVDETVDADTITLKYVIDLDQVGTSTAIPTLT